MIWIDAYIPKGLVGICPAEQNPLCKELLTAREGRLHHGSTTGDPQRWKQRLPPSPLVTFGRRIEGIIVQSPEVLHDVSLVPPPTASSRGETLSPRMLPAADRYTGHGYHVLLVRSVRRPWDRQLRVSQSVYATSGGILDPWRIVGRSDLQPGRPNRRPIKRPRESALV